MIIEFRVGNYKSFKEIVTFSMLATKTHAKDPCLDTNNVFEIDGLSLLKSTAIYGANGSGKSNFISAIRFMRWFVRNSSRSTQSEDLIDVEEFRLSEETIGEPSLFEMVFVLNNLRYRYGFEVDKRQVVSEWLFYVPRKTEVKLFVREKDSITFSRTFREGRSLEEKTRSNALFLSVVAQFNGPTSKQILHWFRMLRVYFGGLKDMANSSYTEALLGNERYQEDVLQLIKKLDLGIHNIIIAQEPISPLSLKNLRLDEMPDELRNAFTILLSTINQQISAGGASAQEIKVKTFHPKYNSEGHQVSLETFDLEIHESAGTRKIFILAGSLVDVLRNGKILIIDELDVRLHPLITCAIIKLFNSSETNPKNAQLIFTTHDTNLLDHDTFRRDQIWFTEKDSRGATHMHSLVEYKVRNDASFEKDYIQGRYGAIPFIGDLRRLLGESSNEEQ